MPDELTTDVTTGAENNSSSQGGALLEGATSPQTSSPDWVNTLPAEFHGNQTLTTHKDLPSFVKSSLEAQKLIGRKGAIVPNENAEQHEWDRFYTELGRPNAPTDYGLTRPESYPEHLPYDDGDATFMSEALHSMGASPKQASVAWEALHKYAESIHTRADEVSTQDRTEGLEKLRAEWGGQDGFDRNLDIGNRLLVHFTQENPDIATWVTDNGLGKEPQFIRLMSNIGKSIQEDTFKSGQDNPAFAGDASEAKRKIDQLQGDPEWTKIWTSTAPEHKAQQKLYNEEYERLSKIAFSGST